jgi:hypothetical protein
MKRLLLTWLLILLLCVVLAAVGLALDGGFAPVGGEAIFNF